MKNTTAKAHFTVYALTPRTSALSAYAFQPQQARRQAYADMRDSGDTLPASLIYGNAMPRRQPDIQLPHDDCLRRRAGYRIC